MVLIVGLGNPGKEYEGTRHNAGFSVIDELGERARVTYWKLRGGALVGEGKLGGNDVVLAKPQSFMNLSGGPVKALLAHYGATPDDLIVVHDEMDIEPGTVRVKMGGGHAGHNGLRSIIDKLGTRDWKRVRVGVGHPPGRMDAATYVLNVPRGDDAEEFAAATERAAEAVEFLLDHGVEKAQQEFNRS